MSIKKISGVYCIINNVNNKMYIGSSVNIIRRIKKHFNDLEKNIHGNQHLQNSYNKYGKENFSYEILEICFENIKEKEQMYIDKYDFDLELYNKAKTTFCPMEGRFHSEETKEKWSKDRKGKTKSEETRKKMSIASKGHEGAKGELNGMFGRKHTDETRKKMGDNRRGKYIGRKLSEETKQKMSIAQKGIHDHRGEKNPMFGKGDKLKGERNGRFIKLPLETIDKIVQLYSTGFYSKVEISLFFGLTKYKITQIIKDYKK